MSHRFISLVATILALTLAVAGCGQAAPAPTPTKAPAAPTKAAEPTKPAAAAAATAAPTKAAAPQPTAAPAKKVDFPQKGKTIQVIVPYAPGNATDLATRLLSENLEKNFGTPVQVVNKPGAGAQVGITEFTQSKPDGYTLANTNLPTVLSLYLDPERKAAFGRKDFQPLMRHVIDPNAVYVRADSPFKTLKDFLDAANAKPEGIRVMTSGVKSDTHLAGLLLQRAAGVKFAFVHAEGGSTLTPLLGGHVEAATITASAYPTQVKSNELRLLAVMDQQRSRFYPDTATAEQLGYKVYAGSARGLSLPGGTPKEIVDILDAALKKAVDSDQVKSRMESMYLEQRYLGAAQFTAFWDEQEAQVRTLLAEIK